MDVTEEEFERTMKLFQGYIEVIYKNHEQMTVKTLVLSAAMLRDLVTRFMKQKRNMPDRAIFEAWLKADSFVKTVNDYYDKTRRRLWMQRISLSRWQNFGGSRRSISTPTTMTSSLRRIAGCSSVGLTGRLPGWRR